ncbi:MAG: hypothetical protein KAH84_05310 [Thiomargarita sp.]|nr:hypothetical protein [Thiomargarita sp.]
MNKFKLLLLASLLFNTAWASDELSMLVDNCTGCHGKEGNSLGPAIPIIASMNPNTFVKAMQEFKNGERPATVMKYLAKAYTNAEFKQMADYFANQKFIPNEQIVELDRVARGKVVYGKYCQMCHLKNVYTGKGSTIIEGQWMDYLRLNLSDFYTGIRDMPRPIQLQVQMLVKAEGEDSIEDIIHYLGSVYNQ